MVHRLRQLGGWVAVNEEGIYGTTISECKSLPKRNMCYTHKEDKEYLFYLYGDEPYLPPYIMAEVSAKIQRIRLLRTGQEIPFTQSGKTVELDTSEVFMRGAEYADCFEIIHD